MDLAAAFSSSQLDFTRTYARELLGSVAKRHGSFCMPRVTLVMYNIVPEQSRVYTPDTLIPENHCSQAKFDIKLTMIQAAWLFGMG